MKIARFFLMMTLVSAVLSAAAMEIPVQRGASSSSKRGMVIAFVDMDRIYKEFPETNQARKEYQEQAGKMKSVLSDKEAELADLREQLSILKAAAQGDPAAAPGTSGVKASSATAAGPAPAELAQIANNLEEKEALLADQEATLAQARREAVKALSEFERQRAAQIFGKLYKSLVQIADEKGVDVVLDKSALLYGQGGFDLTEALSRRVRGLPDEEKP
jgi:Skp family chaperone for outer membrane proteins